jgi:hypothetical protein
MNYKAREHHAMMSAPTTNLPHRLERRDAPRAFQPGLFLSQKFSEIWHFDSPHFQLTTPGQSTFPGGATLET